MALSGPFSLSMALNSNPFDEGIDPTSTFGGYASVLLQLIRQAQPSSTYGMILFDSATPDVSGSNAWRKRCVWLDQTTPSAPVLKMYRASGSPGWVSVLSLIPTNTITTAMIQDAAVTLAKLSAAGGTAGQVIRINAGATAFEFVDVANLFGPSTIPVSRLDVSGFLPGMFRVAGGEYGGGGGLWYSVDTVLNAAGVACLPANALVTPGAYTGNKALFLAANATATEASFREFNPADDIDDGSVHGNKLLNSSVALTKLSNGTAGQVITMVAGVPTWSTPAVVSLTKYTSAEIAIPAAAAAITPLAHGLGAVPLQLRAVLVCKTAELGYAVGDEVDCQVTAIFNDGDSCLIPVANATQIQCVRSARAASIYLTRLNNGVADVITTGNWRLKFYAWL